MGVRGTEFVVDSPIGVNSPKATITVLHGLVEVKQGPSNTLNSNEILNKNGINSSQSSQNPTSTSTNLVSPGQAMSLSQNPQNNSNSGPQPVEPQKLEKVRVSAVVADNTFVKNVTLDSKTISEQKQFNKESNKISSTSNQSKNDSEGPKDKNDSPKESKDSAPPKEGPSQNNSPKDGDSSTKDKNGKNESNSNNPPPPLQNSGNQMTNQIASSIGANITINSNLPPIQPPPPPPGVNPIFKPINVPVDSMNSTPVQLNINFTP